ncbi:DedA family protein [uncultured Cedecea sp.]|uniref:DedA family protein n=1 Tax=uncultured Cedecea sp. TaxID=988762 RepID=UPI00261C7DFC|nr:DedA family protein [uncultured Cedecea sp.]
MDINGLITQYGYLAVIIGSIAEGETITLLGGVAAHQGLLTLPLVIAAAAFGGMVGDQVLFFIGRYFGQSILARFPRYQDKIEQAQALIRRHPYLFVIGCRFMYGFRIVGPVIIGASRLTPGIFIALNIIGAIVWASLFVSLGYLGGEIIYPWLEYLDGHLKYAVWVIIALVFVIAIRLWFKSRNKKR